MLFVCDTWHGNFIFYVQDQMKDFSFIPGMIEPIEQKMLQDVCSKIHLNPSDIFIEYGSFFGRSTNCIIEGIANNKTNPEKATLLVYDYFKCACDGSLAKYVYAYAKIGNVENLILKKDGLLNFRGIFDHFASNNIPMKIKECKLHEIESISNPIAFMHIDSPKFYSEFKYILTNHFKNLRPGSVIIFQDFFYHWSATLIAVVELFIEKKFIEVNETAASSLKTTVLKSFSIANIEEIDHIMTSIDINKIIEQSILRFSNQQNIIDRIHQFLPRLMLANIQHYFEKGNIKEANIHWNNYLNNYPQIEHSIINDLMELKSHNFSIRNLYELDRNL
jgi:hypothetical protein